MKDTTITIKGLFKKNELIDLLKKVFEIQRRGHPEKDVTKFFFIHISNDEYSDAEVRKLIRDNVKDYKVTDLEERRKRIAG